MRTTTDITRGSARSDRGGFTLLEVLLALALFGMMMVGLTRALDLIVTGAVRNGQEVKMIRNLETLLTEASKGAELEETDRHLDEVEGVSYHLLITEMVEQIYNMEEEPLEDMWRIAITATYERNGRLVERVAETYRYEPLYKNQ